MALVIVLRALLVIAAVSCLGTVAFAQEDFGDAPDTYRTLIATNGARHFIAQPFLGGGAADAEPDGQPGLGANNDDINGIDDEDGVAFTSAIQAGGVATVDVTSTAVGRLNAWMDFNANGSFADAGEQIFTDVLLAAGLNALAFAVPAAAVPGMTYSRFRCNTAGGLSFDGPAGAGEVEDYHVAVEAPTAVGPSTWGRVKVGYR